jgi:hypothetical protein
MSSTDSPADASKKGSGATRRPRGSSRVNGAAADIRTPEFLKKRKVSELQEMWGFWQNGHRPPTRKAELLEPLVSALADQEIVRARIEILSDRPREVLKRLVRCDRYRARLPELVDASNGRDLESYEVEAAARALSKRGFVQVLREHSASRRGNEVYVIPSDLGDLITGLLQEERRGPWQVFSLAGHLGSLAPAKREKVLAALDPDLDPDADPAEVGRAALSILRERGPLSGVADEGLRDALRMAAVHHGGLVSRADFDAFFPTGNEWERKDLQKALEDGCLGTITTLALGDFGVDLGGETVVVFTGVTELLLDAALTDGPPEHDRVDAARVDLLTDLQQFLNLVASTPLRVTQGRTIYRAAQHRILDSFIFHEDGLMDREAVFGVLYSLAFGLELVEPTDESRLRLTEKGKTWDSVDLTEKVGAIYSRFLEERLPDGRDFHVRRLRRALAKALIEAPSEGFLPLGDVPYRVRNDYIANLEVEGVQEQYKNRFQYTYSPPKESPADLQAGLVNYVITRLYPLGVVDIAIAADDAVGVRLTDLGRRLIRGESLGGGGEDDELFTTQGGTPLPLVVNPDFEVLLFPEGDVNEVAHTLGRFASRTKSERVAHYRITRETVERAVVKGMPSDEVLTFLTDHSRMPVPQNVSYSIREWAARVRFATQREGVVLTTTDSASMDDVLAVEDVKRILIERIAPTAALLRAPITDWDTQKLLRSLGVYFK